MVPMSISFVKNKFVIFIFLSGDDFCGFGISSNFVIVLDRYDRRFVGGDHIFDGIKVDIQTVLVI